MITTSVWSVQELTVAQVEQSSVSRSGSVRISDIPSLRVTGSKSTVRLSVTHKSVIVVCDSSAERNLKKCKPCGESFLKRDGLRHSPLYLVPGGTCIMVPLMVCAEREDWIQSWYD